MSKWPTQKIKRFFKITNSQYHFVKISWIGSWVTRIDWYKGHWWSSTYMAMRLSDMSSKTFFVFLDHLWAYVEQPHGHKGWATGKIVGGSWPLTFPLLLTPHGASHQKLKSAGVEGKPLKWLESYLTGSSQSVLWNGIKSGPRPQSHGVGQESILGPLLLLVMVADLPKYVTCGLPKAKMMWYTDESTLYHSAQSKELLKSDIELMLKKRSDIVMTMNWS